jgi:tRNA (cmo5U34)-methyltransferase
MDRIAAAGLSARVQAAPLAVQDLPAGTVFDAATLIGVLHHIPDDADKLSLLQALSARLAPGAPLILACNRHRYDSEPLLLEAWAMRWRMAGADEATVHAKLGKIRQGAVPPASEEAVEQMLAQAGFTRSKRFFSSLFWCAWIAFKG